MRAGRLLVDLKQRISSATIRATESISYLFGKSAEQIRRAAEAFYRADQRYATRIRKEGDVPRDGTQLRAWDNWGNEWVFTPEHVISRLLKNHAGKPIGVQYPSKFLDSIIGRLWSRSKYRYTDFESGVHDEDAGLFAQIYRRPHMREAPWARISSDYRHFSPRARTNPVYLDLHGNPYHFKFRIRTGRFTSREVAFDREEDFPRLNAAVKNFQRALSENSNANALVLLVCEAGAEVPGRDSLGRIFANHLQTESGVNMDVFSSPWPVVTQQGLQPAFLRSSDVGVELPGGADSTEPLWIRHTRQGEDIPIPPPTRPSEARSADGGF